LGRNKNGATGHVDVVVLVVVSVVDRHSGACGKGKKQPVESFKDGIRSRIPLENKSL
jgi:hypothetical protein